MAEENKTANKYFINHRKNTEKNLDRTRDRCPTPGRSSLTILTGIHKDFSEWDPHSPAICSRDELSFLVQNILPKCKAFFTAHHSPCLLLWPTGTRASESGCAHSLLFPSNNTQKCQVFYHRPPGFLGAIGKLSELFECRFLNWTFTAYKHSGG